MQALHQTSDPPIPGTELPVAWAGPGRPVGRRVSSPRVVSIPGMSRRPVGEGSETGAGRAARYTLLLTRAEPPERAAIAAGRDPARFRFCWG